MKALDHIESAKADLVEQDYFITITIPSSMNRKGPKRQYEYMDNYIKHIHSNFFISMFGAYEFTQKGNIHAHLLCKPKDLFPDLEFENKEAEHKAYKTLLYSQLKQRSIVDIQVIKSLDNVYTYINKDIKLTKSIVGKSPHVRCYYDNKIQPIGMCERQDARDYSEYLDEEIIVLK